MLAIFILLLDHRVFVSVVSELVLMQLKVNEGDFCCC